MLPDGQSATGVYESIGLGWNSTGKIGRIGRHRAETHHHFNIRFFGPMSPDASDFPGGIPALDSNLTLPQEPT